MKMAALMLIITPGLSSTSQMHLLSVNMSALSFLVIRVGVTIVQLLQKSSQDKALLFIVILEFQVSTR